MVYIVIGAILGLVVGLAIGSPLWGAGVGAIVGAIFSGIGSRGGWGEAGARVQPGWSERHARTTVYKVGVLVLFILMLGLVFLCAILGASLQ